MLHAVVTAYEKAVVAGAELCPWTVSYKFPVHQCKEAVAFVLQSRCCCFPGFQFIFVFTLEHLRVSAAPAGRSLLISWSVTVLLLPCNRTGC